MCSKPNWLTLKSITSVLESAPPCITCNCWALVSVQGRSSACIPGAGSSVCCFLWATCCAGKEKPFLLMHMPPSMVAPCTFRATSWHTQNNRLTHSKRHGHTAYRLCMQVGSSMARGKCFLALAVVCCCMSLGSTVSMREHQFILGGNDGGWLWQQSSSTKPMAVVSKELETAATMQPGSAEEQEQQGTQEQQETKYYEQKKALIVDPDLDLDLPLDTDPQPQEDLLKALTKPALASDIGLDLDTILTDALGDDVESAFSIENLINVAQTLDLQDPAGLCALEDLLLGSDNVEVDKLQKGAFKVGDIVTVRCQPGYMPASGRPNSIAVTCKRNVGDNMAYWSNRLSCGQGCLNSQLVSDTDQPASSEGVTPPGGRMQMQCGGAQLGMRPVSAYCRLDGTWQTLEPCKMCSTTDLSAVGLQLSAEGLMLAGSQVMMTCGEGTYAFPSISVKATCRPGGTWYIPSFQCQPAGCDTSMLYSSGGTVLPEDEGLLGIGASVLVHSVAAVPDGGIVPTTQTALCKPDGTWSTSHWTIDNGNTWLSDVDDDDLEGYDLLYYL